MIAVSSLNRARLISAASWTYRSITALRMLATCSGLDPTSCTFMKSLSRLIDVFKRLLSCLAASR